MEIKLIIPTDLIDQLAQKIAIRLQPDPQIVQPETPKPEAEKHAEKRLGYTVSEFAALFGRGKDWTYKLVYAGKIKRITELGGILIPASEVDRILSSGAFLQSAAAAKEPSMRKKSTR